MLEKTAQIISSYDGLSWKFSVWESENPKGIVQILMEWQKTKSDICRLWSFFLSMAIQQ